MRQNERMDPLSKVILNALADHANASYKEIAEKIGVAIGTVHGRVKKMYKMGIIRNARLVVDFSKLGYDLLLFIRLQLTEDADMETLKQKLAETPRILEAYYLASPFQVLLKVVAKNTEDLRRLLEQLTSMREIANLELSLVLDTYVERGLQLDTPDKLELPKPRGRKPKKRTT